MTRRIKTAFEILTSTLLPCVFPYSKRVQTRTQFVAGTPPQAKRRTARYEKEQKNIYVDNKRTFTSIWDRWQNDATYRKSQLDIGWSDAWVRYLDHAAQIDISHNASHEQRVRKHNLIYLRGMDEDRQASPLSARPGYQEAKSALIATRYGNHIHPKK